VLYAIGGSLIAMVALRRLGGRWLAGIGLALVFGGEVLTGLALAATGGEPSLPVALLLTGGRFGPLLVAYPLMPWLAIMMLGWAFGRYLPTAPRVVAEHRLLGVGLAALALFVVVRGLNGYGNMRLLREDGSLVQWLHVSKYPPSLSFTALELGLAALCLATFLAVLGQTALFFYLLHVHVLTLGAHLLGAAHRGGLGATYAASCIAVVLLYPLCAWYRDYKQARPDGWPRYV